MISTINTYWTIGPNKNHKRTRQSWSMSTSTEAAQRRIPDRRVPDDAQERGRSPERNTRMSLMAPRWERNRERFGWIRWKLERNGPFRAKDGKGKGVKRVTKELKSVEEHDFRSDIHSERHHLTFRLLWITYWVGKIKFMHSWLQWLHGPMDQIFHALSIEAWKIQFTALKSRPKKSPRDHRAREKIGKLLVRNRSDIVDTDFDETDETCLSA